MIETYGKFFYPYNLWPEVWDQFHTVRFIHAVVAYATLLIIIGPLFTPKGGRLHRLTGKIFAYGTYFIGFSAMVMVAYRYFFAPYPAGKAFVISLNLIFDSVFMCSCVWFGLTVLKFKDRKAPSYAFWHLAPPILSIALALLEQTIAVMTANLTFILFPILPNVVSYFQLRYWLTTPKDPLHWRYAHRGSMLSAVTAVIIGFTITGAQVLAPTWWPHPLSMNLWVWMTPAVLQALGTLGWELWLRRKKKSRQAVQRFDVEQPLIQNARA